MTTTRLPRRSSLATVLKDSVRTAFGFAGLELTRKVPEADLVLLRQIGPSTVLDIGANRGQFIRHIRPALPHATIHAFEPVPQAFCDLQKLALSDPKLYLHPLALGETQGQTTIEVNDFLPASSLLSVSQAGRQAFPYVAQSSQQTIEITTLDSWAQAHELALPLAIKVDVQGYEDRVFRGAKQTLAQAKLIICEVSFVAIYENQSLFHDIYSALYSLGFRLQGMLAPALDSQGQIVQADALFVQNN